MLSFDEDINNLVKLFDCYEKESDEECIKNIKNSNINLKELNHQDFDILIFAIFYSFSVDMINFIIKEAEYSNLNYTYRITRKYKKYIDYKNEERDRKDDEDNFYMTEYSILDDGNETPPLFLAIYRKEFKIANLLLEKGADINYKTSSFKTDISEYLFSLGGFDKRRLGFIFNHGYNIKKVITPPYLVSYNIKFKSSNILKFILDLYAFNNDFILHFLFIYNNKHSLTDLYLNEMIFKEKNKISFHQRYIISNYI